MKTLALEFSSDERSVAAFEDEPRSESVHRGETHTPAFDLIERTLRCAGWERDAVECLVVGLGPGSYTGIRLAICVAQGWRLARPVRVLGLGSMDALADTARRRGVLGTVHLALDAQRGEFYLATYRLGSAGCELVEPLRLATHAEVEARAGTGQLMGPGLKEHFPAALNLHPMASALARLATGRTNFVRASELEPVYLRPVQFVKAPAPRILPS
jgi:tRNA threonylcarbamoyl adenosine modification protein YeaZ